MTPDPLRIALVQMSCEAEPRRNLDKALARIEEAAARDAKVVCLQELFRSRYFCQSEEARNFDLAEPIPGPTTEASSPSKQHRPITMNYPSYASVSHAARLGSRLLET